MTAVLPDTRSTEEAARRRADRIRAGMYAVAAWRDEVADAWAQGDWRALGYPDWDAYTDGEFGEHRIRLRRETRREIVASMSAAGMSTRAIASAVGVDQKTVVNDQRSGDPNGSPDEPHLATPTGVKRSLPAGEEFSSPAPSPAAPAADRVTGIDGKSYPKTPVLTEAEALAKRDGKDFSARNDTCDGVETAADRTEEAGLVLLWDWFSTVAAS